MGKKDLKFTYYKENPWRVPWDKKESMFKEPLPPRVGLEEASFLLAEGYEVPVYKNTIRHDGYIWEIVNAPDESSCAFGYSGYVYYVFRKMRAIKPDATHATTLQTFLKV